MSDTNTTTPRAAIGAPDSSGLANAIETIGRVRGIIYLCAEAHIHNGSGSKHSAVVCNAMDAALDLLGDARAAIDEFMEDAGHRADQVAVGTP